MTRCWSISDHEEEMLNNQKRHTLSQQEKRHNPCLGIEKDRTFVKPRTPDTNSFGPKANCGEECVNQLFAEGQTLYRNMIPIISKTLIF